MKTKLIKKGIITTLAITAIISILGIGEAKAALQANPNTQYTKTDLPPANWMECFREIETTEGAMGLSETLNEDLTASSKSNNIDVHMVKTTEYGAVAILSASGYGNPSNDQEITTTTGNNTGVILNTDYWEWTAGGYEGSIFSGINSRYYDTYTDSNESARIGDALGTSTTTNPGCAGWHLASASRWVRSGDPYFLRGYGGIFSVGRDNASGSNYSRGVAVCGTGF